MPTLYEEIQDTMGKPLGMIQAIYIKEDSDGDNSVCYFSARGTIIAIRDNIRDGVACFVSDPGQGEPYYYWTWSTIFDRLGLNFDLSTADGMRDFVRIVPEDRREFWIFTGKCLLKFFNATV